ncbi:MAG: hypothetical protein WDN02_15770 [Methylovirgula sp.]|uniref:hypothetical protein n=1 Tax=Methylovirgula sp. TaxID=1978224 RepID=UPI002F0B9CDF
MGELLAFRAQTRVARSAAPRGEEAEILFFTGVRYIRTETYHEAAIRSDRMDTKRKSVAQREQAPH